MHALTLSTIKTNIYMHSQLSKHQCQRNTLLEAKNHAYICLTLSKAQTEAKELSGVHNTIDNKNYAYMCLTLSEAQMEAKACTYALYNKQRQKDLYMYAFTHRWKKLSYMAFNTIRGKSEAKTYIYGNHSIGRKVYIYIGIYVYRRHR